MLLDENESFDCFAGGFGPLGFPKNFPSVACLGGILQKDLMRGFRAVVATTMMSLLEATTAEETELNASVIKDLEGSRWEMRWKVLIDNSAACQRS